MKISKAELKRMESDGFTVERAMGKQPKPKNPPKPKPKPKPKIETKPVEPVVDNAAMRASIAQTEQLMKENARILSQNNAVIKDFADSVKELKPRGPSPYTFDLERDDDKLLKRVYARPGIVED